jgi:hypothetical protein
VVPATVLVRFTEVAAPEHIVAAAGVAVIAGAGLTVMITGTDDPGHELAVGMILYVTVPAPAPVAVSACTILVPVPAAPPVAPVCVGAAQANVVPGRLPVSEILVVFPEQMVCATGLGVAVGTGLTVIVTVKVFPAHPPAEEVIV